MSRINKLCSIITGGSVIINGVKMVQGDVEIFAKDSAGNTIQIEGKKIQVTVEGSCHSVTTMSGDVEVREHCGDIETMSGDVEVGGDSECIETMSGNVRVSGDVNGSIKSMSGSIKR